jgi:hypothetical protein
LTWNIFILFFCIFIAFFTFFAFLSQFIAFYHIFIAFSTFFVFLSHFLHFSNFSHFYFKTLKSINLWFFTPFFCNAPKFTPFFVPHRGKFTLGQSRFYDCKFTAVNSKKGVNQKTGVKVWCLMVKPGPTLKWSIGNVLHSGRLGPYSQTLGYDRKVYLGQTL